MQEANLAQTILGHDASPVTGSCELDVLCWQAAKINSCIVSITASSRRSGKLMSSTQCRIVGAVGRILDRNIFETETEKRLNRLIRVPYQYLVQFVNLVELILYPGPQRFDTAKPHIRWFARVKVASI